MSEAQVKDVIDAMQKAWNDHDAHAFANCFSVDADFTNVFGMRAQGREAIEAFHAPIFATMFSKSRLTVTETRVRFLSPEIAAVDVRWQMTGAMDPAGNAWPDRSGLMNLSMSSAPGDWSIVVMHNMDLPAEIQERAAAQASIQE
jgi:uncharacterized protein (TIGR02246 family)